MPRPRQRIVLFAVGLLLAITLIPVGKRTIAAAGTPTDLPLPYLNDTAVDGAHGRLFFTTGESLVVTGFDGALVKTLPLPGAGKMVLDQTETTLYVSLYSVRAISAIDTATLVERQRYTPPPLTDVSAVALAGDRLWASSPCSTLAGSVCVSSMDLVSGAWTPTDALFTPGARLQGRPGNPAILVARGEEELVSYTLSGTTATRLASRRVWWRRPPDFALSPDGRVVYSREDTQIRAFRTTDLAPADVYPIDGWDAGPFALSRDGARLAIDDWTLYLGGQPTHRIPLYHTGAGWYDGTIAVDPGVDVLRLMFHPAGTALFMISYRHDPSTYTLRVFDVPARGESELTANPADSSVILPQDVVVTGQLRARHGGVPLPGRTLTVKRGIENDPTPIVDLPPVTTGPDGSYRFVDQPPIRASYIYTVSWEGDAERLPASASASVGANRYANRSGPSPGTTTVYDWSTRDIDSEYHDAPAAWFAVVANPADLPSSAGGATLARSGWLLRGPLLFTGPSSLPPLVRTKLHKALAPGRTVYIVGTPSAVGAGVEAQLRQDGYVVQRLSGVNASQTSSAVSEELLRHTPFCVDNQLPPPVAVVTTPTPPPDEPDAGWVDTLLAWEWSSNRCLPLLFTPPDSIDPSVSDFLARHQIQATIVIGRTLSERAEHQLPGPIRVAGSDRFGTAVAVNHDLFGYQYPGEVVTIFNGDRPDAGAYLLPGWPIRGLLPVHVDALPEVSKLHVTVACKGGVRIIGDETLISQGLERQIGTDAAANCPYFGQLVTLGR